MMRKSFALAAVAATALASAAGCGSGEGAQGGLDVKQIAARVERIRGLEFKHVPKVRLVDEDEFEQELAELQTSAAAGQKSKLAATKRRLAAARQFIFLTGLLTPKEIKSATTSSGGDLAGFYAFKTNELLVLKKGSRRSRESTVAHELTHALEDQVLGSRMITQLSPLSERESAYRALLEGSATLVQVLYEKRYLGARGSLEDGFAKLERKASASKLPDVLAAATIFPYAAGGRFVLALERRGGWKLVDRAHRHPPTTTSSILHPARFVAGERAARPHTTAASALGEGWTKLGALQLGELDTRSLLGSGLPESEAEAIAAGWAGGVVEAFRQGKPGGCSAPCRKKAALHIGWTWRSPAAAAASAKAVPDWFRQALNAQGTDTWELRGGAAALATRGRETHLAFAPSVGLARALAGG